MTFLAWYFFIGVAVMFVLWIAGDRNGQWFSPVEGVLMVILWPVVLLMGIYYWTPLHRIVERIVETRRPFQPLKSLWCLVVGHETKRGLFDLNYTLEEQPDKHRQFKADKACPRCGHLWE